MLVQIHQIQQHEQDRDNSRQMEARIKNLEHVKQELLAKMEEMKQTQSQTEANIDDLIQKYQDAQKCYLEQCAAREREIPRLRYARTKYIELSLCQLYRYRVDKPWQYTHLSLESNGILPVIIYLDVSIYCISLAM